MKKRRHEPRNLCADLLKIRWTDSTGKLRRAFASLEDISPGGACLQTEEPIPVSTPVTLVYASGQYHGTVRHCLVENNQCVVGVQFDPGYRWSSRQFAPAHLLRMRLYAAETRETGSAEPPGSGRKKRNSA